MRAVHQDGAIAATRKDGSVVVFVEDVFYEKLVTFQIPPGVCSSQASVSPPPPPRFLSLCVCRARALSLFL